MRKLSRGYGVCERYWPVLAPEVVSRQVAGDRLLLDENVGQDQDVDVAPGSDHRALNHPTIVTQEPVPAARAAETEPGQPKPVAVPVWLTGALEASLRSVPAGNPAGLPPGTFHGGGSIWHGPISHNHLKRLVAYSIVSDRPRKLSGPIGSVLVDVVGRSVTTHGHF